MHLQSAILIFYYIPYDAYLVALGRLHPAALAVHVLLHSNSRYPEAQPSFPPLRLANLSVRTDGNSADAAGGGKRTVKQNV